MVPIVLTSMMTVKTAVLIIMTMLWAHDGDGYGADGDHVLQTECLEWRALYPLCNHHQTALVALCAAFATRRNCDSMKTNLVI